MRASVVYVPTHQRAKSMLTSHCYVSTCHKRINVSKACQFFNLARQRPKGVPIFNSGCEEAYQFFNYFSKKNLFLNFSIMLNILKFEYLDNCIKSISRNKEFKFWHLQNFIKEKSYQPKTFNVVFNTEKFLS